MVNKDTILKVFSTLEKHHQPTMLELLGDYTPFQMLVMTLLSARTKDSFVIPLVKRLFAKYPNPEDFIAMPIKDLEAWLYGVGFYRVKAKHVKKLSQIIVDKYHGKIPETLEELTDAKLMCQYKDCKSVKNEIKKLSDVLGKYIDEEIKQKIIQEYLLQLIPAGTKGVISLII